MDAARAAEHVLLDDLFDELFPLHRSIAGAGLRRTLDVLARHVPLRRLAVPSGTQVFDWTVPEEWVVRGARLTAPDGTVVADLERSNLHVVNYSEGVDRHLDLEDLRRHLHTLPDLPEAVPYVTSYYQRRWGFCLARATADGLPPGRYHAWIDAEHVAGAVDLADAVLPGTTDREVLISTYVCHPSLANNELSGPLAAVALWRRLAAWPARRFTYRFVFAPETIGSLCYLHLEGRALRQSLHAGLVLTCLGGAEWRLRLKRSRRGDAPFDRLVDHAARHDEIPVSAVPFDPAEGSDERQYCSPGFDLPVSQMARMVYGRYPGYHNSLDDKAAMGIDAVLDSVDHIERLLVGLELDGYYRNLRPFGEVKLDRHGLYPSINDPASPTSDQRLVRDVTRVLSWADGSRRLVDVADLAGSSLWQLAPVVEMLKEKGLLEGPASEEIGQ